MLNIYKEENVSFVQVFYFLFFDTVFITYMYILATSSLFYSIAFILSQLITFQTFCRQLSESIFL